MLTNGSFGFISYNSYDFLKYVLQSFIDDGILFRSAAWFHESLGKEKDHFHVWVEPVLKVDTESIRPKFIEILDDGQQQSIAIRPKCKSDWNNAYLYGVHNSDYLLYKGIEREQVNIKSDLHIYLGDFHVDIRQAEIWCFKNCLSPFKRLYSLVESGKTLEECYDILRTPFYQFHSVSVAYRSIQKDILKHAPFDLLEINDQKKGG